ncbi:DUF502 domain-containing protein [Kangiella koreensis]|uniref:DUF502 domain-containing protein n=1 Tax=Kangiella koreensis (strain DSM 16069 / JCM 12317 / KCTC 12182 / SW-125) TaxID=523791 RepID=C7RCL3_KANKD|nr:DUF502 domain-containing protein [Kangiella koreensis]ACV27005.1 protein of unknown function DUF502 [Kangiella koreensis DSM 16069]
MKIGGMKDISGIFLQGLIAILPILLTIALIGWLLSTLETYLREILLLVISEDAYWPGLGLILGLLLIFGLGLLIRFYLGQLILSGLNKLMERIPFVNTIYNAFNDIMRFLSPDKEEDLKQAVLCEVSEGVEVIGFITASDVSLGERDELVAVYVPMSYQIGGFTFFMPKSKCKDLDMSPSDAMKKVLTASMGTDKSVVTPDKAEVKEDEGDAKEDSKSDSKKDKNDDEG